MRIIIEGADGAGKSTLAKRISDLTGLDVVHMRGRDVMRFPFLYHTLDKVDVIWDRHFLSERIYSRFYDLPYRITQGQEALLVQKCIDQDIKIIVCNPEEFKVTEDEDADIKEEHDVLVKAYEDIIKEYDLVSVDPFKITDEELLKILD